MAPSTQLPRRAANTPTLGYQTSGVGKAGCGQLRSSASVKAVSSRYQRLIRLLGSWAVSRSGSGSAAKSAAAMAARAGLPTALAKRYSRAPQRPASGLQSPKLR